MRFCKLTTNICSTTSRRRTSSSMRRRKWTNIMTLGACFPLMMTKMIICSKFKSSMLPSQNTKQSKGQLRETRERLGNQEVKIKKEITASIRQIVMKCPDLTGLVMNINSGCRRHSLMMKILKASFE